jgi:hypothetical protein
MDRKRYIIRCRKLSDDEINEIKLEVQRELRRGSIRRSLSIASSRSSSRLSGILVSSVRESTENAIVEPVQNVSIPEEHPENQHFLLDLRNCMDIAMTEFYDTDPSSRQKLPKLHYSWKLGRFVTLMNDLVLPHFIDSCENLEDLQYVVYCSSVAVIRCLGMSLIPQSGTHARHEYKPSWKRRLEGRIEKHRVIIGRLTAYKNGNRSS